MKKVVIIIALFCMAFLSSCTVQDKMSPEIFIDRLSARSEIFNCESAEFLYDDTDCVCFTDDIYGTEYVFNFGISDKGYINKISFACNEKDKAENYILCLKDVIAVYSPDESSENVINELTTNGKMKEGFSYYTTQWYLWSSYADDNGLFVSVTNKKIKETETAELSLKPNDKVSF